MTYELTIEGGPGTIKFPEAKDSGINKVDFLISQEILDTTDRSNSLFHTLVIEGEIKDKTKRETKELLDWSLKSAKDHTHRIVTLKIKEGEEVLRDYYLKEMFCVSYQEFFSEDTNQRDSYGTFVLKLRQRKGAIDTIVVGC